MTVIVFDARVYYFVLLSRVYYQIHQFGTFLFALLGASWALHSVKQT